MASPNPSLETYRGIISGSVHDLSFESDPSSPLLSLTQQLTERIKQSGGLIHDGVSWEWQDPSSDPIIRLTTSRPLSSSRLRLTFPGSIRRASESTRRLTLHLHSDQEQYAGVEHQWLVRLGEPRLLRPGLDGQPPLRVTLLGDGQFKQEGLVSAPNQLGGAAEQEEEEPLYIHHRQDGTYTITHPDRLWGTATFVSKAGLEFASDLHLHSRLVLVPSIVGPAGLYEEIDRFANDMPAISIAERGSPSQSNECPATFGSSSDLPVSIGDLYCGRPQVFSPSDLAAAFEQQNDNLSSTDSWPLIEECVDPRDLLMQTDAEPEMQQDQAGEYRDLWADLPRAPTVEPLTPGGTH